VQEKNITYPTGGKLAIKIINRLNKLAKAYGIQQRRTLPCYTLFEYYEKDFLFYERVLNQQPKDSKTLSEVLMHCQNSRGKAVKTGVCDRGYRSPKTVDGTQITLPAPPLKRDNRYQRDKKRKRCQRRAAIEPIIGHLKSDFRLVRNFLKGTVGLHQSIDGSQPWPGISASG